MRLIDADALIDKYGDWYTEEGTEEGYIGTIKGIVDSMPTIDAVPVVLCKDCKHRYHSVECPCQSYDHFYSWMPADDWFCKKGERKEE